MKSLRMMLGLKANAEESENADETQTEITADTAETTEEVPETEADGLEGAATEGADAETPVQASAGTVTLSIEDYDTLKARAGLVESLQAQIAAFEGKATKWDAHVAALGDAGVGGDAATNVNVDDDSAKAGVMNKYFNM